MSRALTGAELAALDRAAAVGFRRDPPVLPVALGDPNPEVAWIAFAAHQRRLTTLPPRAPAVETLTAPGDPRPILPDAARAGLRRLVIAARAHRDPELLRPVAWLLRDRGWRLHPFDVDALAFPALQLVSGPYERWLARIAGLALDHDTALADVLDDAWADLPPAARHAWLARRRYADPDAARALLESVWTSERAEVRLRLLPALQVRLGPGDAPFLASLATDRSGKVRELAEGLLARVPAAAGEEALRAALMETVLVKRTLGLGPKRLVLRPGTDALRLFDAIASRPPGQVLGWLGADVAVLAAAAGEIVPLVPAFALGALYSGALELHATLIRVALSQGWSANDGPWLDAIAEIPLGDRRGALDPLLVDLLPALWVPSEQARWLAALEGPLPVAASRALRSSAPWRELLTRLRDPETTAAAATLIRGLAPWIAPAEARAAAADLSACGPMAAPLVRQTWILLADLWEATDATAPPVR